MTEFSKEARILRMVKRVLTDIVKDTTTPPELKHPLSDSTIQGIRDCLSLITSREQELQLEAGTPSRTKPRFIDEPQKNVVVSLKPKPKKPSNDKNKKD